jgi:hypothetical protein
MDNKIWTGLAGLKANPRGKNLQSLVKGKGAYVNVVAWADSRDAFVEKIRLHVEGLDCILVELENVQLLESRMSRPDYPEELITMRETASRQQNDSVFGTFHTWHLEDTN